MFSDLITLVQRKGGGSTGFPYKSFVCLCSNCGLTLESAGPDAKLGDVCYIYPEGEDAKPILAEVIQLTDTNIVFRSIAYHLWYLALFFRVRPENSN